MKKIIFLLLVGSMFVSCGNDEDNGPTVERVSDDYQPNTVGSTWTYAAAFFDFTQTIVNQTKTINGKPYFAATIQIEGASPFKVYMRKNGNEYINREVYENQYDDGEYIYLKDAVVGTTWTEVTYEEGDDEPIETTDELEIIETGGTHTVGEEEFSDVIVVQVSSYTDGSPDPYVTFYYYAKGVGLIEIEDDFDFASNELISYSIVN